MIDGMSKQPRGVYITGRQRVSKTLDSAFAISQRYVVNLTTSGMQPWQLVNTLDSYADVKQCVCKNRGRRGKTQIVYAEVTVVCVCVAVLANIVLVT